MQIALTQKLAEASGVTLSSAHEIENQLFSWTANWTKVWDNRRADDMIVLVNNATRFTVAIYQVKRKNLKNIDEMMKNAISNTLLFLNINPEIVKEYMHLSGEVEFIQNRNRKASSWVTTAGHNCVFFVGREYNDVEKMFSDTLGAPANFRIVNYSNNREEAFVPFKKMIKALAELTGKKVYKYRAFELLITLDLIVYQAVRRIIVPADIEFKNLHKVMQSLFDWMDYHLHDFTIFDDDNRTKIARIVPFEDDLDYDEDAILMERHRLSEYFPKYKNMVYTYDMGDNWKHGIELVRVIEGHDEESPYLLEISGQSPPEDVGGAGGFVEFRDIMLDSSHPDHEIMKEWARYWTVELSDRKVTPRVIHVW